MVKQGLFFLGSVVASKRVISSLKVLGNPKVHDDELSEQPLPLRRLGYRTYAPQGYAPQGYAPQGYAPQRYAPQGYAPREYAHSEHFYQHPREASREEAPEDKTLVTDKVGDSVTDKSKGAVKSGIIMFVALVTFLVMKKDAEDQLGEELDFLDVLFLHRKFSNPTDEKKRIAMQSIGLFWILNYILCYFNPGQLVPTGILSLTGLFWMFFFAGLVYSGRRADEGNREIIKRGFTELGETLKRWGAIVWTKLGS